MITEFAKYDTKKYWKLGPTDKLTRSAILSKIGIPDTNYWYDFIMNNDNIIVYYDPTSNIWDHWRTKFYTEEDDIKNEYEKQQLPWITPKDLEYQKIKKETDKYNL